MKCAICREEERDDSVNAPICASLRCAAQYVERLNKCAFCGAQLSTARLNYYAGSDPVFMGVVTLRFCSYEHSVERALQRDAARSGRTVEELRANAKRLHDANAADEVEKARRSGRWAHKRKS